LCGPLGYDIVTARCAAEVGGYHKATRQEVAEVIYMPVVVDALQVYGQVLAERGEPFPAEEPSR